MFAVITLKFKQRGFTTEKFVHWNGKLVRQRNSIFLMKRAIASIENVFVYSDRYGHSDIKSD